MNQDTFNLSLRKYLKRVGVTSQHEIEAGVQQALAESKLQGNETLRVKVTLQIAELDMTHVVDGEINLE